MRITPVILTYNNPGVLPRTLAYLEIHGFTPSSVCIIDNGSNPVNASLVATFCANSNIRLISYQTNHGAWCALNNFLEEHSDGLGEVLRTRLTHYT
jgi:hypothetical protein